MSSFNYESRKKRDIIKLVKDAGKMSLENVHVHVDEKDMNIIKVLIVGPKDTPYEGGFYLYKLELSELYPVNPPHGEFLTTNGRIRFHPNYYASGKICLSILNTWSGPQWRMSQNLSIIVIHLKTILDSEPLRHEPSFENASKKKIKAYNDVISFYNYQYAILEMVKKPTVPEFKQEMINYFLNNFEYYMKNLINLHEKFKDNTFLEAPIICWKMKCKTKYSILINEFIEENDHLKNMIASKSLEDSLDSLFSDSDKLQDKEKEDKKNIKVEKKKYKKDKKTTKKLEKDESLSKNESNSLLKDE
jgi:ubiquitin-conjugating enzyme E2 Z